MDKKMIKRIIAREGLIILGLSVALYFFVLLFQNVPVALPKYRLEFTNGEIHTININPEIRNDPNYKRLLRETYNPTPKLIDKCTKEFIRATNIKSALKSSKCINFNQIYISKLYSYFFGILFIFKLAIAYLVLLLVRFIIWAVRALGGRR
ncbi:MAG: hypothetical protein KJ710_05720 [Candidatus Omnitrophica bacterium]|nr:hypothetical protein [Candidatus Omnitrophota bacterium]MBU1923733.1 hypothetical protein [Candidatus Omnitrophota bacterium]